MNKEYIDLAIEFIIQYFPYGGQVLIFLFAIIKGYEYYLNVKDKIREDKLKDKEAIIKDLKMDKEISSLKKDKSET